MATQETGKPVMKTILFGALTVAMYGVVFSHADMITSLFARGSFWAAGPILTVFAFSYVHGSFASNLWSMLGINARTNARPAAAVNRPAPRATVNA